MSLQHSFIPLSKPTIEEDEINEVVASLVSGWITTGPKVTNFENQLKNFFSVNNCLAVNSGTAAWHLLAHSYDIGPGDEVIMPAITWPSMANVVEHLGARPVFADVDQDTVMMDPNSLEKLITKKTKIVLPVHFAGAPADIDAYRSVIGTKDILLAEDCAHALGTTYKGQSIGSNSDAAIFSFHPTKNITTGEGGLLLCKNQERLARARSLSLNGIGKTAWERVNEANASYDITEPGYKYNMLDIQAALGITQLKKLESFIGKRSDLAKRYSRLLQDIEHLSPISEVNYEHKHAWHIYAVKLDLSKLTMSKIEIINKLREYNVGVGVHFEAVHHLTYYRKKYSYSNKYLTRAIDLGASLISLPLYPLMTYDEQDFVVKALKKVISFAT